MTLNHGQIHTCTLIPSIDADDPVSRAVSLCVYLFQGGVKVLITGPWQEASSNYTCLFDQVAVPASLIQPGVLRCYCPGKTGLSGLALTHPLDPSTRINWKHSVLELPGISVVILWT